MNSVLSRQEEKAMFAHEKRKDLSDSLDVSTSWKDKLFSNMIYLSAAKNELLSNTCMSG